MIETLQLLASAAAILAIVIVPGWAVLRILRAEHLLALAAAPAIAAAVAGLAAIAAPALGLSWSLLPFGLAVAALLALAVLARRAGVDLGPASGAGDAVDGRLARDVPGGSWWLAGAALLALGPLAAAVGSPSRILERWDTLYHLSALRRIRDTGDGSSLALGALSNTSGAPVPYPAAFHDLATLVPGTPVPILLNASASVLAVVPWVLGLAVLARVVWPEHRWGPFAAAVIALLAPATPVDEWIHLSPIPNLTGFAMLPGVLAAAIVWWRRALAPRGAGDAAARAWTLVIPAVGVLALAGVGLALLQPNCAVMALLLLAVLTTVTGVPHWRRRPVLAIVPLVCLAPVALLTWTPLAAMVTSFTGGLIISPARALLEVGAGLLTVWPMAIGVVIAALWWPGLVAAWGTPSRWLCVAWAVVAILYLDAAVDSTWDLSILFYRGQDRLSMPLTMLTTLLAVPGLAAWGRLLRRTPPGRRPLLPAVLVLAAVAVAGTSVPARHAHALKNTAVDYPGRGRFLQADEIAAFERAAPGMDRDAVVLASPFSGAAHLYGITGQAVRFPVAGMTTSARDGALIEAVADAGSDPAACRTLTDAGIGYVYVELRPYQYSRGYEAINRVDPAIGPSIFETSHSRLLEVRCDDGR